MNKIIIFDFDGVILDSNKKKQQSFYELYREENKHNLKKIINYNKSNLGINRYDKIEFIEKKILKIKNWKKSKVNKINNFSEIVFEKVLESEFIPGAEKLLKLFYKRYDLFVCSATPEIELKKICKKKNIFKYFKKILGSPKKKYENFNKIFNNKNILKNNIIFIGDANSDYLLAKKMNIKYISIRNKKYNSKIKILNLQNLRNSKRIIEFIDS